MIRYFKLIFLFILFFTTINSSFSQKVIEEYNPLKKDHLRTGPGENDFLPFIQSGYTLMLPQKDTIKGVLIFLEDSGYDKKNKSSKQMYNQASEKGFAVLSVSSEIPFDFYFSNSSTLTAQKQIQKAFSKYNLPNKNIFFLGASLTGHRAMRYIKVSKENNYNFQLNTTGVVICNFTLDWIRKWHQHEREFRIKRNDLGEPKFINYMLETHLNGTPKTNLKNYSDFSSYSYFDNENKNLKFFTNLSIRAYIEPAIKYGLTKHFKTLYENNSTDIIGFIAELRLVGNNKTELIVLQPGDNPAPRKNPQTTWNAIDKDELMNWIVKQSEM